MTGMAGLARVASCYWLISLLCVVVLYVEASDTTAEECVACDASAKQALCSAATTLRTCYQTSGKACSSTTTSCARAVWTYFCSACPEGCYFDVPCLLDFPSEIKWRASAELYWQDEGCNIPDSNACDSGMPQTSSSGGSSSSSSSGGSLSSSMIWLIVLICCISALAAVGVWKFFFTKSTSTSASTRDDTTEHSRKIANEVTIAQLPWSTRSGSAHTSTIHPTRTAPTVHAQSLHAPISHPPSIHSSTTMITNGPSQVSPSLAANHFPPMHQHQQSIPFHQQSMPVHPAYAPSLHSNHSFAPSVHSHQGFNPQPWLAANYASAPGSVHSSQYLPATGPPPLLRPSDSVSMCGSMGGSVAASYASAPRHHHSFPTPSSPPMRRLPPP